MSSPQNSFLLFYSVSIIKHRDLCTSMNFVRLIVVQDKSISRGLSITSEVFSISQVPFFIPPATLRHAPPYPVQLQPPLKTLRNSLSARARAFTKTDSLQNQVKKESAFPFPLTFSVKK